MKMQTILSQLTEKEGLSGAEAPVAQFLSKKLQDLGLTATCDPYGNVYGVLRGKTTDAKRLLFEAHMDQIGLMISGIDENGYLQFVNLGGVDERILPGMEVSVLCDPPIIGIIGGFTQREQKGEETKNPKLEDYRIDVGLEAEEVKKRIHPGDWVQLRSRSVSLLDGKMSGSAMDNRAGIAAILTALEKLVKEPPFYELHILFSTQEELGLHGVYAGMQEKNLDAAIAVDVTHGTTKDSKEEVGVFPLGSGAVICRGPNFHYDYTKQLINLAKTAKIPHEIEVASAESGTTAWAIQTANGGIPVMLLSIPLRYMHTNVETLAVSDIDAVAELLYQVGKGGVILA